MKSKDKNSLGEKKRGKKKDFCYVFVILEKTTSASYVKNIRLIIQNLQL